MILILWYLAFLSPTFALVGGIFCIGNIVLLDRNTESQPSFTRRLSSFVRLRDIWFMSLPTAKGEPTTARRLSSFCYLTRTGILGSQPQRFHFSLQFGPEWIPANKRRGFYFA
jgi:hypothetical protein